MIENPCIDPSVDSNGNQTNSMNANETSDDVLSAEDEIELSPFSFHSHVSIEWWKARRVYSSIFRILSVLVECNVTYAHVPD